MILWQILYFGILLIRILSALSLPFAPLVAWVVGRVTDTVDNNIAIRAGVKYLQYQKIDKSLDFIFRLSIVITAFLLNWPVFWLFLVLSIYRTIGELLIVGNDYFHKQKWFLLFPNVVDYLFPLYILYSQGILQINWEVLVVIALIVKVAAEYISHVVHWSDPLTIATIKHYPAYGKPTA